MTDPNAPLRVVIVDDEELARGVLREYVAELTDVEIVAECANGFEAVVQGTPYQARVLFRVRRAPAP